MREGKSLNFHRDLVIASAQLSVYEKEKKSILWGQKGKERKKVFQEKEKIFKKIFIAFDRAKKDN